MWQLGNPQTPGNTGEGRRALVLPDSMALKRLSFSHNQITRLSKAGSEERPKAEELFQVKEA